MAITMKPEAQLVFFEKIFGFTHPVTATAKKLISSGVLFEVSLYTIKATFCGKVYQQELTKGSTSLMKGTVDAVFVALHKHLIEDWMAQVFKSVTGQDSEVLKKVDTKTTTGTVYTVVMSGLVDADAYIPAVKAVRNMTGWGIYESKNFVDTVKTGVAKNYGKFSTEDAVKWKDALQKAGVMAYIMPDSLKSETLKNSTMSEVLHQKTVESVIDLDNLSEKTHISNVMDELLGEGSKSKKVQDKSAVKPVPQVIHLREAKALKQKVHGTSTGSVYHAIAIGNRVKLAARLYHKGDISIRAEWNDATEDEKKKLQSAGLGMKGEYASIHLSADGVPIERVIGAILLGTGIDWKEIVKTANDLEYEDGHGS